MADFQACWPRQGEVGKAPAGVNSRVISRAGQGVCDGLFGWVAWVASIADLRSDICAKCWRVIRRGVGRPIDRR